MNNPSTDPWPPTVLCVGANQPVPRDEGYPGTLDIHVDASDVNRRILRVHEMLPVTPGKSIYLLHPEWIPGHHRPSGPIRRLAGLIIHSDDGRHIEWQRDLYNVHAFRVDVPAGVNSLDIRFCYLSAQRKSEGPIRVTRQMLDLSWEKVTLYPAGYFATRIQTRPRVTLPAGWQYGTALEEAGRDGETVEFRPIDYLNLVDSPIYAGKHFKRLDLGTDNSPPIHIDIVADTPHCLDITDEHHHILKNIVVEMGKLYGAWHFDHYDFLLSLSDTLNGKGLEHSRSSEVSLPADFFTDWKLARRNDTLPHEFNHSWNGKYRRGAGHAVPNFNVPMNDSLLWVYEGQTQLYGNVVAVRSGMEDLATGLAKLADVVATYDMNRPGLQSWRALQDTVNDPTIAQRAPRPYRNFQGSEDYYAGGQLIWLAVDGKLRELSDNEHCLDDFARAFFGIHPGTWDICTYTADDVYDTLNNIISFDWKTFLRERLDGHHNLSEGLESLGWKLVYTSEPDAGHQAMKRPEKGDFTWSLGLTASEEGQLTDVRWDGPAFQAGTAPSMELLAVNGREFSHDELTRAIKDAVTDEGPIVLLVKEFNEYLSIPVNYHDGPRYPSLERIEGTPDYLGELYASKA